MKRALLGIAGLLVALVSVLLIRAALLDSKQIDVEPLVPIAIDAPAAAARLGAAIRFETVSDQDPELFRPEPFLGLHRYLVETYPRVHAALTREVVADYSLLYTWPGEDPSVVPILMMAHLDVVPVEPGTETAWTHSPFSGAVADGYIWGRGAIDFKQGVLAIMEAVERLLGEGFRPRRTLYFAFGHDEEVGGRAGAMAIASLLGSRNVRFESVLDEGHVITEGILPGIDVPVAFIGIAEKGYLTLELTVEGEGGHSSMPPRHTAVGILAAGIERLEDHPVPGGVTGVARSMFDHLGPEMPFGSRIVFANLWLFSPLVEAELAAAPGTDALLRTTTAVTMFEGSIKENVLPIRARAAVNFRIRPGDDATSVIEHVRRALDDERIAVNSVGSFATEAPAISSLESAAFDRVNRTIREVFPTAVVAPGLTLGATDSRHFAAIADDIYRFAPTRFGPGDRSRFHGTDERMAVENYAEIIRFYVQLIRNANST